MASKSEWTVVDVPDQTGKRIVITGANSGIGLEAARVLADRGAHIVLACRNLDKAAAAMDDILATVPDASLDAVTLDLSSLTSVRTAADSINADGHAIDVLINNAGIMAVPQQATDDGFELQFGTNHLGHFALTGLLLEHILASDSPRVVTVSSNAHKFGKMNFEDLQSEQKYSRLGAYGQSKLANLLFTMELARRFRRAGIDNAASVAAHPGMALTNLQYGMTGGWWERTVKVTDRVGQYISQPAADGALPTLRAATDTNAENGDYFGPARLRESRGPAVKVKPNASAFDVHDARGLWEESVRLTGVSYEELTREPTS